MADEKNADVTKHQQELAASGYRVPTNHYVEHPADKAESTEKESGDGGKSVEAGASSTPIGFNGELMTTDDAVAATKAEAGARTIGGTTASTSGNQGGTVTYASSAAEQAAKDAGLTDADLQGVQGSGADGKLTKADVDKAAAAKAEK